MKATTPNRRSIVVFISGPYRAPTPWHVEQNIRRAEELAAQVWLNGFTALCPHTNSRFMTGVAPDEYFLEGDLEMLRRCDCLLLAPGWKKSKGTAQEVNQANALNMPILYSVEMLKDHYPI